MSEGDKAADRKTRAAAMRNVFISSSGISRQSSQDDFRMQERNILGHSSVIVEGAMNRRGSKAAGIDG
jgi:hypothetical protein